MMEIFNLLLAGFAVALEPMNLILIIGGCTVGLFIGAMPGLGSVNGVAILLPLTYLVPPTGAIIFLAAIYYGAMYGGAISSIMLGIPGASTAVATTFDGRPLAKQGKADLALSGAAVASFVGGTISVMLFTFFAPPLAHVALTFGAPEEFALMMLAFATFIGLGGDDIAKTLFSICIGLVLSAVGLDIMTGEPRLIFGGITGFFHGINFLVLAIGIYGIGEMLWTVEENHKAGGVSMMSEATVSVKRTLQNLKDMLSAWKTAVMGSVLGYFVGILPAAGDARCVDVIWHRQADIQGTGKIRQGRPGRCGCAGIGQQRGIDRINAADADPWHSGVTHNGHSAGRDGAVGAGARAASVRRSW